MSHPRSMRKYAIRKTGALLDDAISALQHAAEAPDAEAVHKMRVSIRRFQQALRLFRQYVKVDGAEKVKADMRAIMDVAGELRNRDIAMDLVTQSAGRIDALAEQRSELNLQLAEVLRPYGKPGLSSRWRNKLGIDAS